MTPIVKWLGIALLMAGALLVSREYEKYLARRLGEYGGLLALICHAEAVISRSLAYGEELWRGFSDEFLEKIQLLPLLRGGESLKSAFDKTKDKMSLTAKAKEEISDLLSTLGRGYRESELSALKKIKEALSSGLDAERTEAEKNVKIARALLLGGALTVVIMGI